MPPRKLNTPLFSFTASGRLGKVLTITRRLAGSVGLLRGRPSASRTPDQATWRTMWQLATELWHQLSATERRAWESAGTTRHMTGYAWFMSQALRPNPGVYLPLAGGTMTGPIAMSGHQITDLVDPVADAQAARKKYVDDAIAAAPGGYGEGASVRRSTNQLIPNAATTPVIFSTQLWDNDGMWDLVPNPTRLTVQTAGIYVLTGHVQWVAQAGGSRYEFLQVNGTIIAQNFINSPPGSGITRRGITAIWKAAVGDYFELACYVTVLGGLDIQATGLYTPGLAAVRIGAP